MLWHEKMTLLRDIALSSVYMHSCQLIHRNLKPANILIDENGRAHIADVDGAASTDSITPRLTAYTPAYAPSQPSASFTNDIYAFGKVFEDVAPGDLPSPLVKLRDACLEQKINSSTLVAALLSIHADFTKWGDAVLTIRVRSTVRMTLTRPGLKTYRDQMIQRVFNHQK
ncbi:hypothetical protein HDV00_012162 [Rhizophlyctis rosea]|nr:hypothetical protein HDV00_012162 [Rhizophlyctis rosea]